MAVTVAVGAPVAASVPAASVTVAFAAVPDLPGGPPEQAAAATVQLPIYQSPPMVAGPERTQVLIAGPEQIRRQWGKPRRRTVIAVCGVIVLAAGGLVAYEVLKPAPPSAASTVQQYFTDLSNDDTAGALALVDKSTLGDSLLGSDPTSFGQLRSAAVLRAANTRPTDVTVNSTVHGATFGGQAFNVVQVSYKAGGVSMSQTIDVVNAPSGSASAFLLENPFLNLDVQDGTGQAVSVNGVAAGTGEVQASVFPGAYTATLSSTALLAGATQAATPGAAGSLGEATLNVTFPAPALAPGAQEAIQAQIKSALDACAQSTSPSPPNCPFSVFQGGSDDSVQWTITTYPSPTIAPAANPSADDQVDITDQNQDGVVQYTDTYTDFSGTQQTNTGQTQFGVSGYATADGSNITVTLSNYF
ncbi:MAG TPA: hypothetical protein VGZ32_20495 [Actinocrinis sp.]|jgi:hypothetical protein|uniref:hypothetical protein n=1 Tax=Actinocrinis sp. TaxID=1920516 RepID=UPI002DDCD795|nr:hypothetical protein [Actinocrinis sp.]HEV3172738.1 hypothetical protein [Actinocrinis sp.]